MNYEKIISAYIKIRDARSALKRKFEEEDAGLKAKQDRLGAELLRVLNDMGVSSIKTSAGLFYKEKDIKPNVSDWDALYRFIRENDAFEALERRVKKKFVMDYMEENDGATPPGVSTITEYSVTVRRNK